jgi:hypothetical protein
LEKSTSQRSPKKWRFKKLRGKHRRKARRQGREEKEVKKEGREEREE